MISSRYDKEKLQEILLDFKTKREDGMTLEHISMKSDVPLKDVISILIEENVLIGEQTDLELIRIILSKNIKLRSALFEIYGLEPNMLDSALVTKDTELLEHIWVQYNKPTVFPAFNGVLFFLMYSHTPQTILMSIATFLLILLYNEVTKSMPKSNVELFMKIFNDV